MTLALAMTYAAAGLIGIGALCVAALASACVDAYRDYRAIRAHNREI